MLEVSIFIILSLFMLGGAIAIITNKQTVFSVFGFLIVMIGFGGMFALLDNRFLALAQIMVSVGAVVVLSMLAVLSVNAKEKNLPNEPNRYKWIIFSSALVLPFTYLIYKTLSSVAKEFTQNSFTSKDIGNELFNSWVLPFEIVSILLLTAMIGAIVIARKENT
ncbi:NADH-quinone oxidoreductase subunit J [Sulfurimonas sp.]|uniref:NADH-quinone oxidoreductase subunit J family protein n=1 Tax=Sulfurimonas sp. TaxID=2022749 RepID=UPI003561653C